MPTHQAFLAFNSGEISPYLHFRTDFGKVPSGAAKMRNFLPLPFGSFSKRPGTQWLTTTLGVGVNSRAFPFISSDGSKYILRFTQGFLKIYRANGTTAATLAFLTGYTFPADSNHEFSIRGIQMTQVNDVAFFTHPRFHPLQLVSLSDTSWTLGFVPFERAPMMDQNLDMTKTYTVASNPVAATWASGAYYAVNAKVFTNCEWLCIAAHTASGADFPGGGATWKNFWRRMFYPAGSAITLLGDDRSEVAWGVDYKSYVVGDLRLYWVGSAPPFVDGASNVSYCVEAHTTDAGYNYGVMTSATYPAATGDKWVVVTPWLAPASGWAAGNLVYRGVNIWKCIIDHFPYTDEPVAEDSFPGTGVNSAVYWVLFAAMPSTVEAFEIAAAYVSGARISYGGLVYVCNTTHIPSYSNRPGVGSQWTLLSGGWTSAFAAGPTFPGKYYQISPQRDDADFQIELAAISANNLQYSAEIVVEGAWNFFTFGTWNGTFNLERSINNGASWEVIRSWQSSADRNVADKGEEDVPTILRLRYFHTATVAGAVNPRALLVPENNSVTGHCLMDTYVGTTAMTGIAKTSLLSGNTFQWSEGAFDLERGFPRSLALHGFRLWFAATVLNPVSVWASRINDFFDFETGLLDDDGIFRTLAASNHQAIRWLASTRRLFLGTSAGEWVEGSETSDEPITPTNIQFRKYTPTGSCSHQPLPVHDGLFFLGRNGGRLYELGASESNDTFSAGDLSRLAEHLTAPGISNFAFQQTREPCLWAVTRDGNLLSFNYSRSEQISAWAMHTTQGGLFRDVVIFPSETGDDEVFFIIDRGSASHLERFPEAWQATQEAGTTGNYVDAAGLTGGSLPIASELRVPPQDMTLDGGGTQGRRKRANEILLNVYQSFGGGISYDGQTVLIDWSNSSDAMDMAAPLKNQWVGVTLPPAHMDDLQFSIVHSDPYPFTIRAAVLRWSLHEP